MPVTTFYSPTEIKTKSTKDKEIVELLKRVHNIYSGKMHVLENITKPYFFRKEQVTYFIIVELIPGDYEYQELQIPNTKDCVEAYLYGLINGYADGYANIKQDILCNNQFLTPPFKSSSTVEK